MSTLPLFSPFLDIFYPFSPWVSRFKELDATHTQTPRVINVDLNAAYPPLVDDLKADEHLPSATKLRQVKYLNNQVEQDHRFIKRLTKPGMGFGSFNIKFGCIVIIIALTPNPSPKEGEGSKSCFSPLP